MAIRKKTRTKTRTLGEDPLVSMKEESVRLAEKGSAGESTQAEDKADDQQQAAVAAVSDETAIQGRMAAVNKNADTSAMENDGGISNIILGPVVSIAEVKNLYMHLQAYIDTEGDIYVDASRVQMLDMAGLQLLLVFVLELEKSQRTVHWQNPSPVFRQAAELMDLSGSLRLQDA